METKRNILSEQKLITMLEEWFSSGTGDFPLTVTGHSMTPFIAPGRDTAFLSPAPDKIKKGDIILFEAAGGKLLLHRVIKTKHGYVTAGDASVHCDAAGVKKIYAVCKRIKRKNKIYGENSFYWFFFAKIWIRLLPFRGAVMRLRAGRHKTERSI